MNWIDYVIIGVIGFSSLISLLRGFVKEALSLVIWFGAFFVASHFHTQLANFFTNIQDPTIRNGVAIAVLFVATLVVGSVINALIGELVQKTGLSTTDRVLGVVFGSIRGVLIVAATLFFFDAFTDAATLPEWKQSWLIPQFRVVVEWFFAYLEQSSSFLPKMS